MAEHAFAAGDEPRAPPRAGCSPARRRCGVLRSRTRSGCSTGRLAVEAAVAGTRARALLARARPTRRSTAFAAALADIDEALALARGGPDRRLEMAALRARGRRRARSALGLTVDELVHPWRPGCGSPPSWATARPRRTSPPGSPMLEASRLRLATALAPGRAVARAGRGPPARRTRSCWRSTGSRPCSAYLGEPEPAARGGGRAGAACSRARGDTWLLQWAVFESSFVAAAEGGWDDARARVAEALEVNRLSGYPAYAGYFRGARGLVRPAGRRPRRGAPHRPGGRRGDLAGRPPVVVRHRRRAAGRHAARGRRPGRGRGRRAARAGPGRDREAGGRAALPGRRRRPSATRRGLRRGHPSARRGRVPARPAPGSSARTATCCSAAADVARPRDRATAGPTWLRSCRGPDAGDARHAARVDGQLAQISSATS